MTSDDTLRLRWQSPAAEWVEGIPLGNGRTGAMLLGDPARTRLQLNDSSAWSGTPDRPAAALDALLAGGAGPERLGEVRAAIDAGDYRTAEELLYSFEGPWSQEFLPFADLELTTTAPVDAAGYTRELDLDRAVATETWGVPGARVRRTTWATAVDGVVVMQLESDAPGRLDLRLALTSPLRVDRTRANGNTIALGLRIPVDGAPLHEESVEQPLLYDDAISRSGDYDAYGAIAVTVSTDGTVRSADVGDSAELRITGARRLLLVVGTDTTARSWWNGVDPAESRAGGRDALIDSVVDLAERARSRPAGQLLGDHESDVARLLGASTTRIGPRRGGSFDVATDILRGDDDALVATVLHEFGRYLLVSSSRPGSPPANLQGIWNDELRPPWSSNYTININTQMNYWAAEPTALAECHEPLLRLIDRLQQTGSDVAARLYGARGWVAHHNTDPWGWALPVGAGHGNPSWAIWMMGGLWLTDQVWQHWNYTRDRAYLAEQAWPILSQAAEFALDWLVDDGSGGLRTVPSTSPENLFRGPDGHPESLAQSSTMDMVLIGTLFIRVRRLAAELGLDHPVLGEIAAALPRLVPFAAASGGWLREWGEDLTEVDPDHRHMSQMVTVYPLGAIDSGSPGLAAAAKATLDRRGNGAMGWSWAWKIALRARLGDGETARELLREASAPFERDHRRLAPVDGSEWGGLLPNLFSTHPPFQLDGNYGFTAGIREMLVGTAEGDLRLLPALPAAWREGAVTGARVPGALAVDLRWQGGAPVEVVVRRLAPDAPRAVVVVFGATRAHLDLVDDATRLDCSVFDVDVDVAVEGAVEGAERAGAR
ncbi:glycoside hydrolase family 95 protein [Herbiconiux daphne]|uniref:Glycoside hydrolase family 95 protein n=1 Tax=Herbiconiux daphne TaxID=2970914 RepID=A0ABT2H5W3_9MICO|nr:glycoside hydrolase family 95 protein [Herbiconiux daphne]MCS5735278.1 glycoside hydrolase family 95 protein [Herbiconiux daphne]